MSLRQVVIGIDFSAPSVLAARWAVHHVTGDADVVLVHSIELPVPPAFLRSRYPKLDSVAETARLGAERRLEAIAATLGTRASVRTEVRVGDAAEQIADVARTVGADLIIVGRHGERSGVWRYVGTTADHLIRVSPVPVLLATGVRDVRPRRILVALDDSAISGAVVRWASFLAHRFGADVSAVHVVSSAVLTHVLAAEPAVASGEAPGWEDIRQRFDVESDRWMRALREGGLSGPRVTSEVAFGEPGHEILGAAEREGSELIVVGQREAGAARRFFLGSVVREVLHGARCPVLVVVEPESSST
jgi:nucleotide-binding universal stress UspA family protein